MATLNKVQLIGNLGRDPELRHTPNGTAVVHVSLATTSGHTDKAGARQEETEWHRVTFFGRLAEVVAQYMKKGRPMYVEGRLRTRKWEKDGQDHHTTEVIASDMQMLGARPDDAKAPPAPSPRAPAAAEYAYGDADVPF